MLEQGVRVSGAIVSWSLSPTKREELEKLYSFCGLSNFLPGETTEVAALRAAMEDVKGKNQRVEALEKPSKHGYEIVLIERGKVHNDHTTSFTAKVENGVVETGWGYTDTQALRERYEYRKSLLSPSSVSNSLGKIALHMNGTCLYPGTFWIPQSNMQDWQWLAKEIEAIGEGNNRMRRLTTIFDEQTMDEVRQAIAEEIGRAAQEMMDEIGTGELGEKALVNRMCHLPWQTPTDAILDGFAAGLEFEAPTVPVLPDNWRNKIPGVGGLVRAFHRKNPGRLAMFPEDRAEQSSPWPSPRSWANAINCMAAAQSVGAEKGVELALLEGLVGKGVAVEFSKWREHLDLPDPEELLAKAHDALEAGDDMEYEHPDRADKVMAMIAAVSQRVHDDLTVPRWEAAMHILEQAALHEMDVSLSVAKPLATVMPKGAKMSATFVQRIFPRMKRALRLPM